MREEKIGTINVVLLVLGVLFLFYGMLVLVNLKNDYHLNFKQLNFGQTPSQVEEIFGEPSDSYIENGEVFLYVYAVKDEPAAIRIKFYQNKVVSYMLEYY